MIAGVGLDVVEIARMERAISAPGRGPRFLARVFSAGERAYCAGRASPAMHFAARFAAKEAFLKALGAPAGVRLTEVEVVREAGSPALHLVGSAAEAARRRAVRRSHLSLTHDGGVAAAVVILEAE